MADLKTNFMHIPSYLVPFSRQSAGPSRQLCNAFQVPVSVHIVHEFHHSDPTGSPQLPDTSDEGVSVKYLKLHLGVRKIIHRLKNQHFEHHHVIKRRATGITPAFFAKRLIQHGLEKIPVDCFVEFFKRVAHCAELRKFIFNVKKADLTHEILQTSVNMVALSG
jgi:hypothetical protein